MTRRAHIGAAAAPFVAVLLIGCQSGNPNAPAKVTGKVTYNGSALPGGSVTFHFKEGGLVSAPIAKDGTYSAADIPIGEAVVTVETESANPDKPQATYGGGGSGAAGGAAAMYGGKKGGAPNAGAPKGKGATYSPAPEGSANSGSNYVKIPKKYTDPKTSGLSATINKGKQTINFDLTD